MSGKTYRDEAIWGIRIRNYNIKIDHNAEGCEGVNRILLDSVLISQSSEQLSACQPEFWFMGSVIL